jgi:serine/threonine protein kinase
MFKSKTIPGRGGKTYYIEREIASRRSTKHSTVVNDDGDRLLCISIDLKKTTANRKAIESFYSKKNPMEEIESPYILKIHDKVIFNNSLHVIVSRFDSSLEEILVKKDKDVNYRLAKKMVGLIEVVYQRVKRYRSAQNQISLSNIFVREGELVFGGWDLGELTTEFFLTNLGPFYYKAPELLERSSRVDFDYEKSDMWSFGVCLYALNFGVLPFKGNEREEVLMEIRNSVKLGSLLSAKSVIPPEMINVIAKLLVVSRSERIGLSELREASAMRSMEAKFGLSELSTSNHSGRRDKGSLIQRIQNSNLKMRIDTNLLDYIGFTKGESLTTVVSSARFSVLTHSDSKITTGSNFKLKSEDEIDPDLMQYLFEKNVIIFVMDCARKIIECQSSKWLRPVDELLQLMQLLVIKKAFIQNYYISQIMANRLNIFNIQDFERKTEDITYQDLLLFFRDFHEFTQQMFHKVKMEHLTSYPKSKDEVESIELMDTDSLNKKLGAYLNLVNKFYKKSRASMAPVERTAVAQVLVYLFYNKNSDERFEYSRFGRTRDWVEFCTTLDSKSYLEIEKIFDTLSN